MRKSQEPIVSIEHTTGLGKSAKKNSGGLEDSLGYSESEQLQFSHPPKDSRGPKETTLGMPDILEEEKAENPWIKDHLSADDMEGDDDG